MINTNFVFLFKKLIIRKEDELESASAQFQDLSNSLKQTKDSMEKEVSKWKMLYESLYLQYDNELHAWEDSLTKLEKQRDEREVAFSEETRRKERVVSGMQYPHRGCPMMHNELKRGKKSILVGRTLHY